MACDEPRRDLVAPIGGYEPTAVVGGPGAAACVDMDGKVDRERAVQTGAILAEGDEGLKAPGGRAPRRDARRRAPAMVSHQPSTQSGVWK